ncbi:MAG: DUF72 domain-containing protein [Promethearchaeota archaeon]|jgi:uncharacterized protein YecE (DUF72 family)
MARIEIGTAGWDYKDWTGNFYPKRLERSQHLAFYSKYFNLVEINSTFYNLPSKQIVENWFNQVPQDFRFVVKVWQNITHTLDDPELDSKIISFFSTLTPLKKKLKAILLQFPPWFKFTESHLKKLKTLLNEIPSEYKYIIELRDDSWFNPEILSEFIDGVRLILGTTYKPGIRPYFFKNQNYYYIRLIGDRELTIFNRIQRKQGDARRNLKENIEKLEKKPSIQEIFIIVNNHFQGFAPESANELKKKFGLSYTLFSTQTSLSDFIK